VAVDPSGRDWTAKELVENLRKCDGGTKIWGKAKRAIGKDPTIGVADSSYPSGRTPT
jgi:hypothetical protein